MTGVLQQAAPKPKSNPMLDQIVQQEEEKVPENLKNQFLAVMTVGGKLMWSEQMTQERQEFDQLIQQSGGDVTQVVAHTVLKIIAIIQNESQQKEPLAAVGLAAPIFMSYILQYVEAKHGIPVTKDLIDQTAQLVQVNLLKMYGVTDQHIQALLKQRAQGQGQQPQPSSSSMAQSGTEGNAPEEAAEGMPGAMDSAEDEDEEGGS